MERIVNASQNLTLLMIRQRDVLNQTFQKYVYDCNDLFQDFNRLPLKEGEKYEEHVLPSTSVLSSVRNTMSVQDSAKVKEKEKKHLGKEGMGSKNVGL